MTRPATSGPLPIPSHIPRFALVVSLSRPPTFKDWLQASDHPTGSPQAVEQAGNGPRQRQSLVAASLAPAAFTSWASWHPRRHRHQSS
ncbi:hypothetical protein K402DRAFT_143947 [Aulographum hederae CBS 113979]|uniref:Uncharacterized protein n=1 Tax=Aulographum hederae CBS 113979 TaxID=1176131 RepID=A0A6G1GUF8_9PEZI|nr:hypothetical protein K402DRAFT_143947 [Aulographum hederae CBS 113979]